MFGKFGYHRSFLFGGIQNHSRQEVYAQSVLGVFRIRIVIILTDVVVIIDLDIH